MKPITSLLALSALVLLGGCASVPTGPSIMALPGTNRSFDQFRRDDVECRQYAFGQIGGTTAEQNATESGLRSAAVGTAIGAVAGAAMGGRSGAGVGAGAGLLIGSVAGSGAAQQSERGTQRHYDNAYIQCMYSKGDQVPVAQSRARSRPAALSASIPPPPPSGYMAPPPPPPPGSPPPPPPDAVLR